MNIPGCHEKLPSVCGNIGDKLCWRQRGAVTARAVPHRSPPVPAVPVPVPGPRSLGGRHRAVPSGAAGPGQRWAGSPGAHIWRQPGQGSPRCERGVRRSSAGPGLSRRPAAPGAQKLLRRVPRRASIPARRDSLPGAQPLVPPARALPAPLVSHLPSRRRCPGRSQGARQPRRPRRSAAARGEQLPRLPAPLPLARVASPPFYSRAGSAGIYSGGESLADVMLLIASPKEREEGSGPAAVMQGFPAGTARLGTARHGATPGRAGQHPSEPRRTPAPSLLTPLPFIYLFIYLFIKSPREFPRF